MSSLFSLIEEPEKVGKRSGNGSGDAIENSFSHLANPNLRELKSLLKDIGISHTTLEEVFMKVTGKKESKLAN